MRSRYHWWLWCVSWVHSCIPLVHFVCLHIGHHCIHSCVRLQVPSFVHCACVRMTFNAHIYTFHLSLTLLLSLLFLFPWYTSFSSRIISDISDPKVRNMAPVYLLRRRLNDIWWEYIVSGLVYQIYLTLPALKSASQVKAHYKTPNRGHGLSLPPRLYSPLNTSDSQKRCYSCNIFFLSNKKLCNLHHTILATLIVCQNIFAMLLS